MEIFQFKKLSCRNSKYLFLIILIVFVWISFYKNLILNYKNKSVIDHINKNVEETYKLNSCNDYFRKKEPRVLCVVFTHASSVPELIAIHETWSKK